MIKQGVIYFGLVLIGIIGIPISLLLMQHYQFDGALCGAIGGLWTVVFMGFAQGYIRKNGTGA